MAHKKAAGSTSLGRESESKRLGVKITDGQVIKTGMIIIRQRGSKYRVGLNVKKGKDDTLFAMKPGFVKFTTKKFTKFDGSVSKVKVVNVMPTNIITPKAVTSKQAAKVTKVAKAKK